MLRTEKEQHMSFIKDVVGNSEVLILANIEGLNASQVSDLRKGLHEASVGFRVIKNKLAKKAVAGTDAEVLSNDFMGSTAIAWSEKDPITPAKLLIKFEKEFEKLQLKAGFNAKQRLSFEGIEALSKLPSLEELRSQLLGLFTASASRLLAQINAPTNHVVGVVQAKIDKDK